MPQHAKLQGMQQQDALMSKTGRENYQPQQSEGLDFNSQSAAGGRPLSQNSRAFGKDILNQVSNQSASANANSLSIVNSKLLGMSLKNNSNNCGDSHSNRNVQTATSTNAVAV